MLYFPQHLRDEAHRFAIITHRVGRSKDIRQSELDEVPGIWATRKRELLNHFGSAQGRKQAGLSDLENPREFRARRRGGCLRIFIRERSLV